MNAREELLVLAPLWSDAEVICRVLSEAGFHCRRCDNIEELCHRINVGAGALLLTEEALGGNNRQALLQQLQSQPAWSDLPVTLLLSPVNGPSRNPVAIVDILPGHNVTILQRPVPSATLTSVLDAALRARRRQYQLRDHLHQRKKHAELLEQRVQSRTKRLKELSEQYQAARDLFYTLFQSNPLPLAIARLEDGLVLDVNDALLRYFDSRRDAFLNHTAVELERFLPVNQRRKIADHLRRHGPVQNFEVETTHPSGETKTALMSVELVTVKGVEAALVALADISERKRAEQQIRDLASRLTEAEHEERHRIAQILHDDLQQQLYGLQIQLSFLRDDASEQVADELDTIEPMLNDAIKTVRDLSVDLSPPILHDEGLVQGLNWIAGRMQEQYRLQVNIQAEGSFPVSDDGQRVLIFQILRELLFNAVKHAGVEHVSVRLAEEGHNYRIDVIDQGTGFDPQEVLREGKSSSGRGLISACQRLRLIGGRLEIDSTPGQGTCATIYTPAQTNL